MQRTAIANRHQLYEAESEEINRKNVIERLANQCGELANQRDCV